MDSQISCSALPFTRSRHAFCTQKKSRDMHRRPSSEEEEPKEVYGRDVPSWIAAYLSHLWLTFRRLSIHIGSVPAGKAREGKGG